MSKEIAITARWLDHRGAEKTITKSVEVSHKTHIIVLPINGAEVRIKVSL